MDIVGMRVNQSRQDEGERNGLREGGLAVIRERCRKREIMMQKEREREMQKKRENDVERERIMQRERDVEKDRD